jgi:hypothetical protein
MHQYFEHFVRADTNSQGSLRTGDAVYVAQNDFRGFLAAFRQLPKTVELTVGW